MDFAESCPVIVVVVSKERVEVLCSVVIPAVVFG